MLSYCPLWFLGNMCLDTAEHTLQLDKALQASKSLALMGILWTLPIRPSFRLRPRRLSFRVHIHTMVRTLKRYLLFRISCSILRWGHFLDRRFLCICLS